MKEFKTPEINEIKKPEPENFKDIKPENGMNTEKAKSFWNDVFDKLGNAVEDIKDKIEGKEFGAQFNSEKHMIEYAPAENSEKGHWKGERGNSEFIPNENTEAGMKAKEKLAEYGQEGIRYKNGEPDFSKCAEATVKIDNMTENRPNNFRQADTKCAEQWNTSKKDGRSDWTRSDVRNWRHENNCSWHERCDTKTMDLVSQDIHTNKVFPHSGGVSECKKRDNEKIGGIFDE